MGVDLNQNWIEDIRMPIEGDSFEWYSLEPPAAKKALVIHHSASPTNQDGYVIASYHVNTKGWGGIGYHFVIRHDEHPKGAGVEYVGDLGTMRAHVEGQNQQKVGICLVGNFKDNLPGKHQLELARQLIDFLISPNNILPSISFYSQVMYHNAVPGYSGGTDCPGWTNPNFNAWFSYLQGGAFPDQFYAPVPAPLPEPTPVPEVNLPEWEATYHDQAEQRTTTQEAYAVDMTAAGNPVQVVEGQTVDVAGYFTSNGKTYARTVYAKSHNTWYGLPTEAFDPQPTGQPSGDVSVSVAQPPVVESPVIPVPVVVEPPKPKYLSLDWLWALIRLIGRLVNRRAS